MRDRVLTPSAAGDNAKWFRRVFEVRRRVLGKVQRQSNDDFLDVRMRQEHRDASLEDGAACDGHELLGDRAPNPAAASSRSNDRRYEHSPNYIGAAWIVR